MKKALALHFRPLQQLLYSSRVESERKVSILYCLPVPIALDVFWFEAGVTASIESSPKKDKTERDPLAWCCSLQQNVLRRRGEDVRPGAPSTEGGQGALLLQADIQRAWWRSGGHRSGKYPRNILELLPEFLITNRQPVNLIFSKKIPMHLPSSSSLPPPTHGYRAPWQGSKVSERVSFSPDPGDFFLTPGRSWNGAKIRENSREQALKGQPERDRSFPWERRRWKKGWRKNCARRKDKGRGWQANKTERRNF